MIDLDVLLTPFPGDNPTGEDLRYDPVYDQIKEARRADDPLDRGDWDREIKAADWDKVVKLSVEALSKRTKDLQIAAWLTEALTKTEGFEGFNSGLRLLSGFLRDFWDNLYPEIDEGDLDYRVGPLEFLNNNLWLAVKGIPLTDPRVTPGYSWLKWQESRQVGYEKDTLNQYGDADEGKKAARDEKIGEGKLTGEEFDAAVVSSSKEFYAGLGKDIGSSLEAFQMLDGTVDEKFGKEAPRLSEIRQALEDCQMILSRIQKDKGIVEPGSRSAGAPEAPQGETVMDGSDTEPVSDVGMSPPHGPSAAVTTTDSDATEQACWQDAIALLEKSGIRDALGKLLDASCRAPSVRQKNRYRLLMAKTCLRAGRADLARPIVEELHALIEELNLEQWESPLWIAEILDAYYKCLTAEGSSDEDLYKANNELFQRLCTKDITRAITYRA